MTLIRKNKLKHIFSADHISTWNPTFLYEIPFPWPWARWPSPHLGCGAHPSNTTMASVTSQPGLPMGSFQQPAPWSCPEPGQRQQAQTRAGEMWRPGEEANKGKNRWKEKCHMSHIVNLEQPKIMNQAQKYHHFSFLKPEVTKPKAWLILVCCMFWDGL